MTSIGKVVPIHQYGHVCIESVLGNDLSIVNNARVSFDQESDELGKSEVGLLNFLMRNGHGSPWESVVFRMDVKAPLFIIREWQRHRVGSFNEQSARYSEIPAHVYVPERDYVRTQVGKPGNYSFEPVSDIQVADNVADFISETQVAAFNAYHRMLDQGIAKELARVVLPVGMYSRMKWTVNLRSLLNFLALRNHEHAQREIRDYASVVESLVTDIVPEAMAAFTKNGRVAP